MKLLNHKKDKGFTIIETLVAITILMIAIAGPLTIAQKGFIASIYARDQVTASFLAQDMMEAIKNEQRNLWSATPSSCKTDIKEIKFTKHCTSVANSIPSYKEITFTVVVSWSNGTIANSVTLVNTMYDVDL